MTLLGTELFDTDCPLLYQKGSKGRVVKDAEAEASSHREAMSNLQSHLENEVLEHLLLALLLYSIYNNQFCSFCQI